MKTKTILFTVLFLAIGFLLPAQKQIKLGIIAGYFAFNRFTKLLNSENREEKYSDFRIVAAYPYGSKTIKSSYERIPDYIKQVEEYGVEIVPSITDLLKKVDCVLLETNDGNLHLEQAYEVFKSGKIMFIDKPVGATLAQANRYFQIGKTIQCSHIFFICTTICSANSKNKKRRVRKSNGCRLLFASSQRTFSPRFWLVRHSRR